MSCIRPVIAAISVHTAPRNEDYNIVNARLTYLSQDEDWRVALECTNATDKYYVLNTLNTAYASSQPGTPRLWAISVRRNFSDSCKSQPPQ